MVPLQLGHTLQQWVDNWHEFEGGNDLYGVRPQCGVSFFQAKMNGLSYKSGYETASDDMSNDSKAYDIQTQKLGMGKDRQQEGKVLNRIVRCTEVGWEIEASSSMLDTLVEH